MATITIKNVDKRNVTIDVTWNDGLKKLDEVVSNCPVEDFTRTAEHLYAHVTGIYQMVRAEADRLAYENPTPDPQVLAAVGKTFGDAEIEAILKTNKVVQ